MSAQGRGTTMGGPAVSGNNANGAAAHNREENGYRTLDLSEREREELRAMRKRKMQLINEIEQVRSEVREVDSQLESLCYLDEGSRSRSKVLSNGRKKFNQDAWRGIEYLIDKSLLSRDARAIAQWLFQGEGLSKNAIGEVLGGNEPFALQILDEFVHCHDFTQMSVVDALRRFLWSFRLPGESQKIDRIMERFAQQYVQTNPGVFPNADVCHTIAYSCIMLNTLLHNPNVKDRPSFERYQLMNKELLDNESVGLSLLQTCFDSIRSKPFKIPEDEASTVSDLMLHAERDGWLYKQSSNQFIANPLSWKRRWFVLTESCLYYFDQKTNKEPRGIIPLQNVGVRKVDGSSRPHMFEIYSLSDERIKACKAEQDGRLVEGRHSVYRICAADQYDLRDWIDAIAAAVSHYPIRPRSTH